PYRTIKSLLRSPKDPAPLFYAGVYCIPCRDCNAVYIGETGRTIRTRMQEHKLDVRLMKVGSAVAEHARDNEHSIAFENVRAFSIDGFYHRRTIREGLETRKHNDVTDQVPGREISGKAAKKEKGNRERKTAKYLN